ncbi:hypothetical protein FACS189460_4390 [Deltaproteobacteria bacterium]|nr:hypothetical protein FACS189460_4390 [Deltaproteobacteria bacterium]
MKKTDLLLFGTGKIARMIYSYITDDPAADYRVAGFCLDAAYWRPGELFGLPVVKFEEAPALFPPDNNKILVAIGYQRMNSLRAEKCLAARASGYELASFIHSGADVSSRAKIGPNCVVLDNVSVEPFAELGENVFLHCQVTIAHNAKVAANTWVASGTVIGGNSRVGPNCFLGINVTIGHNLTVGAENFIGAGAVLTRCTDDQAVHIVPDTPKHRLKTDQFLKLVKFD